MESCENTSSQTPTTQLLHQLCDACLTNFPPHGEWPFQEYFRQPDAKWTGYILRECTLRDICIAAAAGCHLCAKMLNALDSRITMETQIRLVLYDRRPLYMCALYDDSGREKDLYMDIYLERLDHKERHASLEVQSVPFPDSNLSPFALNKAKEWLHLCRHTHQQCRPGESTTLGPQQSKFIRLIHIQFQDRHSYTCRLVNHFLGDDVDYMTLSYRWTADVGKTVLTQKNKAVYYDAIPTNTWPRIYHDAVSVARHLKVQYLWIDALCIIQDDPEDWNEQAALMNIIYERGVLNLAGVMGEKADGLRVERDPLAVFECALSHPSGEIWVFQTGKDRVRDLNSIAPLYKRGWTFQERVLSPRTLHFGIELVWECFESVATETTESREPSIRDPPLYLKQALRYPFLLEPSEKQIGFTTIQRFSMLWRHAVEHFSYMHLTKPSDRLPALQGITNRLGYHLNLDPTRYFVAGLWLVDCTHLAWCRENGVNWLTSKDDELARELSIHYPSWSWAISTEGARFNTLTMTKLVEFGADLSHCRSAADPRFITIDKCISAVSLDNTSPSSNMQIFTGITLRGKFIHWFEIRKILKLGQSRHRIKAKGFIPATQTDRGASFIFTISLDRPISNCNKRKGLKLLPIQARRDFCLEGILIAFCGFDGGVAVYRRLGHFEVKEYPGAITYFHLPPRQAYHISSEVDYEWSPEFRRELDDLPPFKLI